MRFPLRPVVYGAIAGALVLAMTAPDGPALDPDSMSYFGAAQSFLRHRTLRVPWANWSDPDSTTPLIDFPPGYSFVLAGPLAAGVAPRQAARAVEALSAAVTLGVLTALVEATGGALAGGCLALLLLVTPAVVETHLWVMSEPLFFVLLALTLNAMVRHPERPHWYGLFAALSNLVRYAGVALVAASALWALAQPAGWRDRLRRSALAIAPGAALQGYWAVLAAHGAGTRTVSDEMFGGFWLTARRGVVTVLSWLAPAPELTGMRRKVIAVILALLIAALLVRRLWSLRGVLTHEGLLGRRLFAATALFGLCYIGVVSFARLFVGAEIEFDARILSPLFICSTVLVAIAIGFAWTAWPTWQRVATAIVVVLWLAMSARTGLADVRIFKTYGLGYEAAEWQDTPFRTWLRTTGREYTIYSNDPAGVWFLSGRPSRLLPGSLAPDSVRAFAAAFAARPSLLVGFDAPFTGGAAPDSVARRLSLQRVQRFEHGVAWLPAAPAVPGRAARDSPNRR